MNLIGFWIGGYGFNLETWSNISVKAEYKPLVIKKRIYHRWIMFSIGKEGKVKQFKKEFKKIEVIKSEPYK